MKKIGGLVLLLAAARLAGGQTSPTAPFVVTITAPHPVKVGEPAMIHIVLQSTSENEIVLGEERHPGDRGEFNYNITVKDAAGTTLPDSDVEQQRKRGRWDYSGTIKSLHWGDQIVEDADLNGIVKITSPGDYTVQAERVDPERRGWNIRSNKIVIQVRGQADVQAIGVQPKERPYAPVKTPEQGLTEHHIPLDTPSVVAALRNPDPHVRSMAAEQLGGLGHGGADKHMEAIPAIETALDQETNDQAKINMAAVLASMNDQNGLEALASICENQGVPVYKRLDAARHLFESGGSGCSNTIMEALKAGPDSDPEIRQKALSFVSHLPEASKLDAARYIGSNELRDTNPVVRIYASRSLLEIGDAQSVKEMEDALSHETDPYARIAMETSINALINKVHHFRTGSTGP